MDGKRLLWIRDFWRPLRLNKLETTEEPRICMVMDLWTADWILQIFIQANEQLSDRASPHAHPTCDIFTYLSQVPVNCCKRFAALSLQTLGAFRLVDRVCPFAKFQPCVGALLGHQGRTAIIRCGASSNSDRLFRFSLPSVRA